MKKRMTLIIVILFFFTALIYTQPFITGKTVKELNETNESSKCEPPEIEIAERNLLTMSRLNNDSLSKINDNTLLNTFCNKCLNVCNTEIPPTLREQLSRFLFKEVTRSLENVQSSERMRDSNGNIIGFNNKESSIAFNPPINEFEDLSKYHDFSITKGCLRASFSGSMNLLDATIKPRTEINILDFINLQGDVKLDFKKKDFDEWGCSLNFKFNW